MVALHEHLNGNQQADHFLFIDLHAAGDGVGIGAGVEAGGLNEVLATHQDAGALRRADEFSPRKGDEVETHFVVEAHALDRQAVGRGIDECGNTVLLAKTHPVFALDAAFGLTIVKEQGMGSAWACHAVEVVLGFNLHKFHATRAHRVVVAVAMGLLDQHFILETRDIRQADNFGIIRARDAACCTDR